MKKSDIWIVMPAYNEARYLKRVLKKTQKYHSQIIMIDDGSNDQTSQLGSKLAPYFLAHKVNLGKGAAIKTGCEFAFNKLKAKAVILMDADDQHDPTELKQFIQKLLSGSQIVFGVREINQNMLMIRRMANNGLSFLVALLFGRYIPDIPSGFRALTHDIWLQLNCQATGYEIETEMAVRVARESIDFDTVCITTTYHDMNKGMTFLDALKLVSPIINWRFGL